MSWQSILIAVVIVAAPLVVLALGLCRMAARSMPTKPTDEDVEKSFDDIWQYGGTDD